MTDESETEHGINFYLTCMKVKVDFLVYRATKAIPARSVTLFSWYQTSGGVGLTFQNHLGHHGHPIRDEIRRPHHVACACKSDPPQGRTMIARGSRSKEG